MISYLKHLGKLLQTAFWPLPTLIAISCFLLAESCVQFDSSLGPKARGLFPDTSAEGLRTLISTAASGVITLAALVFSTTLVALTLASSQFGPRLLHNFIRARTNQITLGMFLGTFLFSLVVLRATRAEALPLISASAVFFLTLASLALFLYFVHHLVRSLQAENIVASVAEQLFSQIESTFEEVGDAQSDDDRDADALSDEWENLEDGETCFASDKAGYLQYIDISSLMELATKHDCRIRVMVSPGELILNGTTLFTDLPTEQAEQGVAHRFLECFVVGNQRTSMQDFEFEIRQLVEIGIRALSPGINDPFTAVNCIDFLAIAMAEIAEHKMPQSEFEDEEGICRLRLKPTCFRNLLETAFLQLQHDGASRPDICMHMFRALLLVGKAARTDRQRKAILDFSREFKEVADAHSRTDINRKHYTDAFLQIEQLFTG